MFTRSNAIIAAFLVGFWSLCGQFVFNRIIFFYVANSEYTAASIISLHLLGLLVGSLAAKRYPLSVRGVIAASFVLTAAAQFLIWTLGVAVFGFVPTLVLILVAALMLALFSGLLFIRLIDTRSESSTPAGIVIADSLGSVAGAVVGGFFLVPVFGLNASFVLIALLQIAAFVIVSLPRATRPVVWASAGIVAAVVIATLAGQLQPIHSRDLVSADGLPLPSFADSEPLYQVRSPYGVLTVLDFVEVAEGRGLFIDNRAVCHASNRDPLQEQSEWRVGEVVAHALAKGRRAPEHPRIAVIGLGCGITLSAILAELPPTPSSVDVVEINPRMAHAQRLFDDFLPFTMDDPRAKLVIRDGFAHFTEPPAADALYDGVVIDVAWMQNMNATHIFSAEMYENVSAHMTPEGVLSVWSEETNPLSEVSLIIFRTLSSVFAQVYVEVRNGAVLFYALKTPNADVREALSDASHSLSEWMAEASQDAPINRLNNLVMNRHKFTMWGDSTFDSLRQQYANLRETIRNQ